MGKPSQTSRAEILKYPTCCDLYAENTSEFLPGEMIEISDSKKFITFEPF
jgi:hypothetical protein